MARKKISKSYRTFFVMLFILGLLFVTVGGIGTYSIFSGTQSFSLIGEERWLPRYLTGECITRADNMAEIKIASHTDNPKFYSCTTNEVGKYIPIVNGVQCEYFISEFSFATIYTCNVEKGEEIPKTKDDPRCIKDRGVFDTFLDGQSVKRISVNAGDYIYIDTDKTFGDAKLSVKYPSYGLRVRSADGFVSPTTNSCEINSLSRDYHTIDVDSRTEIIPDVPFNAVSGLQRAISTQAVTLDDVENSKEIYITRPGYYYMIKQAEDGFKYVDTASSEKSSANIECIPRTTGCSDEAKIIKLVDQSCDKFGGSITNYAPVQGDNTQLCKYTCSSGSLKLSNDCIEVQKSCPADKPLWDTSTGLCTSTVPQDEEEDDSYLLLGLLAGGLVLAGVTRRRALEGQA